jgi:hypothetical protein
VTPDPPDSGRTLDLGFGLGWPWDPLAEAVLRADAARKRAWAAQVEGDRAAQQLAEWDLTEALGDHRQIRQQLADQWLAGMRAALDLDPSAVAVLLDRFPVPDPVRTAIGEVEDAVLDAEERLDKVEDAVLDLEADRSGVPG